LNAKQAKLGEKEALELVEQVSEIYAAKGKKLVHLKLKKDQPSRETLKKLMLGPTGNLRAPTLRKGKTLLVGFDEETYEKLLG
jgi:arsenate reductase-like glutaredoxin family protein